MTSDEALKQFGLPAQLDHLDAIRRSLAEEIDRGHQESGDQELLRTLCAQLFSLGAVEDSLSVWAAKNCNFDAMRGLDVQFLCGAGLQPTKKFLAASSDPTAAEALTYLARCEQTGDFADFNPAKWIGLTRDYYRLDDSPPSS